MDNDAGTDISFPPDLNLVKIAAGHEVEYNPRLEIDERDGKIKLNFLTPLWMRDRDFPCLSDKLDCF